MRITGGNARGIQLQSPKGKQTRPATDALREAVFSSIAALLPGSRVIDLFAGTGAYGLEALSRGAVDVSFVESNRAVVQILEANCTAVKRALGVSHPPPFTRISACTATSWLRTASGHWDLIFIDPPYDLLETQVESVLALVESKLRHTGPAFIILECPAKFTPALPDTLSLVRRLGKTGHQQPNACLIQLRSRQSS